MQKSLTTDYTDGTDDRGFSDKEVVTEVSPFGEQEEQKRAALAAARA